MKVLTAVSDRVSDLEELVRFDCLLLTVDLSDSSLKTLSIGTSVGSVFWPFKSLIALTLSDVDREMAIVPHLEKVCRLLVAKCHERSTRLSRAKPSGSAKGASKLQCTVEHRKHYLGYGLKAVRLLIKDLGR